MSSGKFVKYCILSISSVSLFLILCPTAFSEAPGKTATAVGAQQEQNGSETQKRIAEPNMKKSAGENKSSPKTNSPAATKITDSNNLKEQPQKAKSENVTDGNTSAPEANDFNEYKQEINKIDMEARGEESKWLGKVDKKSDLAKAMDNVVAAELKFLRKIAESDDSKKTVDAIDLLLKKRQERLAKLTAKLDEEAKSERRERRPSRTGAAGAGMSEQGQTQTTRPQRRTREPVQQNNANNNAEGQQQ